MSFGNEYPSPDLLTDRRYGAPTEFPHVYVNTRAGARVAGSDKINEFADPLIVTIGNPALVDSVVGAKYRRRPVRLAERRRGHIRVSDTPLLFDLLFVWKSQVRRHRNLPRSRRPQVETPLTQVVVVASTTPTDATRPLRVRGALARRSKRAETVPPQFNPPYPFSESKPRRDVRGLLRRGKRSETTPPQFNPPYPFSEIHARHDLRSVTRRQRFWHVVPPQFNPPYPFAEVAQPRRARGLLRRRSKPIEAPIAQVVQLQNDAPWSRSQQRRDLRSLRRYVRRVEAVQPQLNPPYPFSEIVRRKDVRSLTRKQRVWNFVASPVAFVQNDVPWSRSQRRAVRGMRQQRGRVWTPTSEQSSPTVETKQPRLLRGALSRRARRAEPIRAQQNPPNPIEARVQPRRLRGLLPRRARRAEVVQQQFNPIYVAEPKRQPRRLRGLLSRRSRRFDGFASQAVVPAGSAVVSILGAPAATIVLAGAPSASVTQASAYTATVVLNAALGATVTVNGAPQAQIQ